MFCELYSLSPGDFIYIFSMGYSDEPQRTRFGPGSRKYYIVHYVVSGKGYFNGNPVLEGEGFLIFPNMPEHYYPDEENPWSFIWFISDDPKIEYFFNQYAANPLTNIFKFNLSGITEAQKYLLKNQNAMINSTELFEIYLHIFNSQSKSESSFTRNSDVYCHYAVNYIESNLFRPIRISELVCKLGISQPYLYNIFTEKYGISPKQYINQSRIIEAKRMLSETKLSITEIANSVGYNNVLDFSKFFKFQTGLSPKKYKSLHSTDTDI